MLSIHSADIASQKSLPSASSNSRASSAVGSAVDDDLKVILTSKSSIAVDNLSGASR